MQERAGYVLSDHRILMPDQFVLNARAGIDQCRIGAVNSVVAAVTPEHIVIEIQVEFVGEVQRHGGVYVHQVSRADQCGQSEVAASGDAFTDHHISLGQRIRPFLLLATQGMSDSRSPIHATDAMPGMPEISPNSVFDHIIGSSPQLTAVFELVSQVAPVDTSVLITGESGTGKERVADSIHALSRRKSHPLIKVNCAALPANLIESELFGHEKGAFTGAMEKRIGRFEQANQGTIFLDEIGDVPLETQVKLLRVLQQREIERIGGKAPVKVNIRIIAATNKSLEKEVAEGRFRLDLYYRLNVFPIQLPSLNERKEDIPLLVNHFLGIYSRKTGRKITGVSDKAMAGLMAYEWPGNIRELENIIERAIR